MNDFFSSCCCFPSSESCSTPAGCDYGPCLVASHILLCEEDSVACNESGHILWENTKISTEVCTGEPTFTIISHSDNLTNVNVNSTQLNFSVVDGINGADERVGKITYRISCDGLSTEGTVTILIKSNCHGVICGNGTVCDDCSGECVAISPDISTSSSDATPDLSITP
jgi:hypothetical protein